MASFKRYLINEEKSYLGQKIGDTLSAVQNIQDDMENMGTRHLSRMAEKIVNQIRQILHSQWSPKHLPKLKELQRIAVALQKTIEEKGDLRELIPAATSALEKLSGDMGTKVNNLPAEKGTPVDMTQTQTTEVPQQSDANQEDLSAQSADQMQDISQPTASPPDQMQQNQL